MAETTICDPFQLLHTRLGNYEILELLGLGGTSAVYRGVHAISSQQVAIKCVPYSPRRYDLFAREAALLSGIEHPHIIHVADCDSDKGLVYMVHAVHSPGIEKGAFLIYALTSKDKVKTVEKLIFEQIQDLATTPISDEEFQQGLAQVAYFYRDRVSSLDSLASAVATDSLYGRGYDYYAEVNKDIAKLKKRDVQTMAKKYLVNPQIFIFQKK